MADEKVIWDYVECNTIWEAEYIVGFPVLIPRVLGTADIQKIAVIGKTLVEICYVNDICYRTAEGEKDISGDYNKYEEENKFDIKGNTVYHVTAKGFFGKIYLAIWTDETYTYSISIPHGVSPESLEELIKSLTQVNDSEQMGDTAISNPMVEYHYIFEAEYAAGFSIAVPAVLGTEMIENIYVISNKVAELVYKNGIIYRTGRGKGDISGIYKTYAHEEIFEEGRFHVTAKGNADLYYVSVWTDGDMTWSLYCPHGIHKESLIVLINSMRVTNSCNAAVEECTSTVESVGAYGCFHVVTEEEKAIFNEANDMVGVYYEPLLAATQVVAGSNYRFICNAKVAALHADYYLAQVTVFVPLSGGKMEKPVITDIKRLD